jgi:toxin CptA
MSIAVSAIVQPSRLLTILTIGMSLVAVAVAVAAGLGMVGGGFTQPVRFLLAAASGFVAVFGFYHGSAIQKTIHIDISGTGQIRVRKAAASRACVQAVRSQIMEREEVVRLLSASTIWPHMLLLHLRAESGKITVLPILPDSVSRKTFRALAVACRWIALQPDAPGAEVLDNPGSD